MTRRVVSVAGSSPCNEAEAAHAYTVGRLLAEREVIVVTGGLGGAMESASAGAKEAGGLTVGLLPGTDPTEANPSVEVALPTGLGESRNVLIARVCDALVAIGTGFGTLSEMAFALKNGTRVVALDSWDLTRARDAIPNFYVASTPEEAVKLALA
jgi:hypothetical protein